MNWRTITEEEFRNLDKAGLLELISSILSEANNLVSSDTPYEDVSRCLVSLREFHKWRGSEGKNKVPYKAIQKCDELEKKLISLNISVLLVRQDRLASFWNQEIECAINKLECIDIQTEPSPKKRMELALDGRLIAGQIITLLMQRDCDPALVLRARMLKVGFMESVYFMTSNSMNAMFAKLSHTVAETKRDYESKKSELEQRILDAGRSIEEYESRQRNLLSEFQILNDDYNLFKTTVGDLEKNFKENITESERGMLGHVLSLMGVFSAITTIIMGLVISATSWLNGLDVASAAMAFVVPSLIAVVSSIILLSLVFCYLAKPWGKVVWGIVAAGALILLLLFAWTTWVGIPVQVPVSDTDGPVPDHALYTIAQFSADEISGMAAFQFSEKTKILPMTPENVHPEGLYYCVLHDALE